MLRREWDELTKQTASDEEWEIAHTVYQRHPMIPNVGGKEKLLKIYKLGGYGLLRDMTMGAAQLEPLYEAEKEALRERDEAAEVLAVAELRWIEATRRYNAARSRREEYATQWSVISQP